MNKNLHINLVKRFFFTHLVVRLELELPELTAAAAWPGAAGSPCAAAAEEEASSLQQQREGGAVKTLFVALRAKTGLPYMTSATFLDPLTTPPNPSCSRFLRAKSMSPSLCGPSRLAAAPYSPSIYLRTRHVWRPPKRFSQNRFRKFSPPRWRTQSANLNMKVSVM